MIFINLKLLWKEINDNTAGNMGFCKSWAEGSTIGNSAYPSFGSGLTSNIGHQFLISFSYLHSAAVPGRQLVNSQPSQSPVRCASL